MRPINLILLFCACFMLNSQQLHAQGCVAVRSTGGMCTAGTAMADTMPAQWELYANNRYFKSFRHFVGTDEQKQRVQQGTEVINHQYSLDITLLRHLKNGWSLAINLPVNANTRSSLYEHGGNAAGPAGRHSTHSFGLGDIRITAYKWLLPASVAHRGNIQAGLGIKLPTGDYQYEDYFIKSDGTRVLGPVDQSIQLGDGGTGITGELNGYYDLSHRLGVFGNIYYLLNPREQNGVSTARGGATSASSIQYHSDVMSVPDQYMLRAGIRYSIRRFGISAALRDECIPVHDLVGGSDGFRRPGYIISAEPGLTYELKHGQLYAYVPLALVRSRTQSVPDKIRTELTGVYAQGDAAFADYLINVGISVRF